MIGIAQNEIFKVLTIVSIAGIPPTLIASIYGMNFKNMPELSWTFGYPYGLTMIVAQRPPAPGVVQVATDGSRRR